MNKIITRALMRHHNDFFKMSEEEQDIFKLQDHEDLDDKVEEFISVELAFNPDDHSPKQLQEYNETTLHYRGIGPNYFMLNEFGWKEEVLKYKNFYDYNKGNHDYQEEAFTEEENFPDYETKELYNRLNDWARGEIDGQFYYLSLYSLEIWMFYALEEAEHDWVDANVPYELVSGPNDGKKVDGGSLWDMRRNANGKEGWLEQMQDFARKWINGFYDSILYDEKWDLVFINDKSQVDDPSKEYIFGSMGVLKHIGFKTFVDDCEEHRGDSELAYQYRDQTIFKFLEALDKEFIEVQKTPPNVVQLKKKKKIIFADGALDGLE